MLSGLDEHTDEPVSVGSHMGTDASKDEDVILFAVRGWVNPAHDLKAPSTVQGIIDLPEPRGEILRQGEVGPIYGASRKAKA